MSDSPDVDCLRALIVALDKRHVQPHRAQEAKIASDAVDLRAKAIARLSEIQPPEAFVEGN